MKQKGILEHVVELGKAIHAHLMPHVEQAAGKRTLHGIGAMWCTNLKFGKQVRDNIQYQRLLPYLNLPVREMQEQLKVLKQ